MQAIRSRQGGCASAPSMLALPDRHSNLRHRIVVRGRVAKTIGRFLRRLGNAPRQLARVGLVARSAKARARKALARPGRDGQRTALLRSIGMAFFKEAALAHCILQQYTGRECDFESSRTSGYVRRIRLGRWKHRKKLGEASCFGYGIRTGVF